MGATERNDPFEVEAIDEAAGGAGFLAADDRRARRAARAAPRAPHAPRARRPGPLPVKLLAVEDVRLPATAGLESQLDAFYVGLLGFERVDIELPRPRPKGEPLPGGRQHGHEWRVMRRGRAGLPPALARPDRPHNLGPVYRAENFRVHFD